MHPRNKAKETSGTPASQDKLGPEYFENLIKNAFRDLTDNDEPIDSDSDFFEIGGDSIRAAKVIARLRQEAAMKITMRDLFNARTVTGLAALLVARDAETRRP
jgi:acyl carrier protein